MPGGGGVSEGAAEVAGLRGHAQCAGGAGACHICVCGGGEGEGQIL